MKLHEFRTNILIKEIDICFQKVNHFDDLRLRTRQTCITLWTAALGVALTQSIFELYILAIFIPLPFWIIESRYRLYQRGWHLRLRAIRDFIRDEEFNVRGKQIASLSSFLNSDKKQNFPTIDFWARKTVPEDIHKVETSFIRNIFSMNHILVYFPLCFIALLLGIFKVLNSLDMLICF